MFSPITSGPVVHESPTPVKKLIRVQQPGPWLGFWRCLLCVSWLLWFWMGFFLKHLPIFILCVCMSACIFHVRAWCLWWLEEGVESPGTRVSRHLNAGNWNFVLARAIRTVNGGAVSPALIPSFLKCKVRVTFGWQWQWFPSFPPTLK